MKALSIQQPWPWLIIRPDLTTKEERLEAYRNNLFKDVENRRWKYLPSYRGPLAIHASQTFDLEGWHWVRETFPSIPLPGITESGSAINDIKGEFQTGGFVGKVYMVDADWESDSPWFIDGCVGIRFGVPNPVPFIPYKGQLGIFSIDPAVEKRIKKS